MSEHYHSLKGKTLHETNPLLYQVLTEPTLDTPPPKAERGDGRQGRVWVWGGTSLFTVNGKNVKFWQKISSEPHQSPAVVSQRRKCRYYFASEHFRTERPKQLQNVWKFLRYVHAASVYSISASPTEGIYQWMACAAGELEG